MEDSRGVRSTAELDPQSDSPRDLSVWLLVKRDLYYCPNGEGYTGVRDRAGRYTEAEAKKHCYDAGPNGNSVTMVRLTEAPEFSKACYDDIARAHLRQQRDDLATALRDLRLTSRLLLQNAEGCAVNHYGLDFEQQGLPGWLHDCRLSIERAEAAISEHEGVPVIPPDTHSHEAKENAQ